MGDPAVAVTEPSTSGENKERALSALSQFVQQGALRDGEHDVRTAPAAELITVGEDGFPFCCLLSRRQLTVRQRAVVALVHGRRPNAQLGARGVATLSFVHDNAFVLARLSVESSRPSASGTIWTFNLVGGEVDSRAELLRPISYAAPALDRAEGDSIDELLDREGGGHEDRARAE